MRMVLIHALKPFVSLVEDAFARLWWDPVLMSLLDEQPAHPVRRGKAH